MEQQRAIDTVEEARQAGEFAPGLRQRQSVRVLAVNIQD